MKYMIIKTSYVNYEGYTKPSRIKTCDSIEEGKRYVTLNVLPELIEDETVYQNRLLRVVETNDSISFVFGDNHGEDVTVNFYFYVV